MDKKEQDKIIKNMSVESVSDDKVYKKGIAGQILTKIKGKLDKFGLPIEFNWENLIHSPKELKELKPENVMRGQNFKEVVTAIVGPTLQNLFFETYAFIFQNLLQLSTFKNFFYNIATS